MSPRLELALNAAYAAGRFTLGFFNNQPLVSEKPDQSPVTEADLGAEKILREMISSKFPDDSILGEEQGLSGDGDSRWIVDPIDGTKSFVCGVPLYGVLVAFERASVLELGVCYFPALDEMIFAERGHGCFWNGRACRVSDKSELKFSTISCGSHASLQKYNRMKGLLDMAEQVRATRTWCDAYGHALVATGRVEAMIDPVIKYWDVAAMKVIVEEAGGRFTNFAGGSDISGEAVSSNALLHEKILGCF